MTVLAWDGTTLAADKLNFSLHGMSVPITKIRLINDELIGVAGKTILIGPIMLWAEMGFAPEHMPEQQKAEKDWSTVIRVQRNGTVLIYENSPIPWKLERNIVGMGSGGEIATGAMAAGASAEKAVLLTFDYIVTCGLGVDTLQFPPLEKKTPPAKPVGVKKSAYKPRSKIPL